MRRVLHLCWLSGWLVTSLLTTRAFAQEPAVIDSTDTDDRHNTEQPKQAERGPAPVLTPPAPAVAPALRPKVGDLSVTGYFRGGFGASGQKGRMTCFQLALPGNLFSKYRLGNECEVWSETHFTMVTFVGDDGAVASLHVMPTVFIPTTYIGYPPTGVINSPLASTTSTGATLSFPNLYADLKGIPWLFGGTAWVGSRYYKRESIYISDFFYWNPSGVGAGIEDIQLGGGLLLSYGAFAVDGETVSVGMAPPLPERRDFGVRNDLQLRGLRPWESGELQFGFQYIANFSDNPATHGGWGVTVQFVQKVLGGDNRLALQYGKGGGTGFGTLARFYYPDFSLRHDPSESRIRAVEVLTIQPTAWFGQQLGLVYQRDDLGNQGVTEWYSAGSRVALAFTKHAKLLGEAGYDRVKKSIGADPQWLAKFTIAAAIGADRQLLARPELRLFFTWAMWDQAAAIATVDSGQLYTMPDANGVYTLSGAIFGMQAETWW
jgi:maltoporin